MKKLFAMFAAALFCANVFADQAVTVNFAGSDTNTHFPVYGDNANENGQKVQAIYLADQLNDIAVGSEIKALTFYSANQTQSWGRAEFRVSLAKTNYSFFQNVSGAYATASEGSTLTAVYEGSLSVADGELTIHFTTPYTYEGGNLLIQVDVTTKGSSSASSFYSVANTSYLIKYATNSGAREAKQPKVTFVIAGGDDDPVSETCAAPTAISVETVTDVTATISWQGEASQYQYCLAYAGDMPDWTAAQLTNQESVTVSGLYDEQKYYLYVRSYCSATAVSEAVRATFKTACARQNVPWVETFTRDDSGSETVGYVAPDCWVISSAAPAVTIVAETTDDGQGNQIPTGQQHLNARGGGDQPQVFALPIFNAQLDTCELAFDYYTSVENNAGYGSLEIGYMTNPADAATFVSLNTFAQTITSQHVVFPLNNLPAGIEHLAFRFAGGTSTLGNVSMDNFVLAGIGKSGDVDLSEEDLPDPAIWSLTYCDAGYTWYYRGQEEYFGMLLISDDLQDTVAAVFASTADCAQFAQQDGVGFSQNDDYENRYYFNTRYILNVDETGLMKFGAFNACTVNIGGSGVNAQLGLKAGRYHVEVYEMYTETDAETEVTRVTGKGSTIASIPFTIINKQIYSLQAEVAEDHTTATITWEASELEQGERFYVRVWSGETVAYDNFNTNDRPTSPLTVNVEDGKSYTVAVIVLDKKGNAVCDEKTTSFTVGTNNFEPQNPQAVVAGGDNVTFSWTVGAEADRYVIVLFCNGEYYTSLTVSGTSKMTTMPKDGTWTWTVQAFNLGSNGNYFEASNAIEGNSFVSKAPDIPDDAVVMNVWGMEAGYLDKYVSQFPANKYGWMVMFATGEEGGTGMPMPYFLIYTDKENAISGVYNVTRGNIDLEACYINTNGTQAGCIMATDAEVRLQFVAYDDDKAASGYRYGYYTGQFRMVCEDGNTYVGKFMEMFCNSFNYSTVGSSIRDHKGMWDEDPDYIAPQGIESIQSSADSIQKVLHEGQLYIVMPNGFIYNAAGMRVK